MSEFEVMKMLANVGLPYLSAGKNQWIDGDGKTHDFRDMGEAYLKRCIKTMEQQKSNVIDGFFLSDCRYDMNNRKEIIHIATALYENKLDELEEYMKNM